MLRIQSHLQSHTVPLHMWRGIQQYPSTLTPRAWLEPNFMGDPTLACAPILRHALTPTPRPLYIPRVSPSSQGYLIGKHIHIKYRACMTFQQYIVLVTLNIKLQVHVTWGFQAPGATRWGECSWHLPRGGKGGIIDYWSEVRKLLLKRKFKP